MSEQKHGAPISAEEFDRMRKAYEEKYPGQTKSVLFSTDVVQQTLSKPNVRVYLGLNDEGRVTVIFKGEGDDVNALADEPIVNKGKLCPPYCD